MPNSLYSYLPTNSHSLSLPLESKPVVVYSKIIFNLPTVSKAVKFELLPQAQPTTQYQHPTAGWLADSFEGELLISVTMRSDINFNVSFMFIWEISFRLVNRSQGPAISRGSSEM